jgi:hypothetical protein
VQEFLTTFHIFLDFLLCVLASFAITFSTWDSYPAKLILNLEQNVVQHVMYFNMYNLGWFVQLYFYQFQLPLLVLDLRMQSLGLFFQVYVNKNQLFFFIIIGLFQIGHGFFLLHIVLFHLVVVLNHMFMVILKCF